jgi:hypothetical protein
LRNIGYGGYIGYGSKSRSSSCGGCVPIW